MSQSQANRIKYEAVICLGPAHLDIAQVCIRYLDKFLEAKKIHLLTNRSHFDCLLPLTHDIPHLNLVDENKLFKDMSLQSISNFMEDKIGNSKRAGWYFQQFLKMEAHKIVDSDYYLIWDADTIPLKQINFFPDRKGVWIQPSKEHHKPYFETIQNLVHLEKIAPYSFISEHMMVFKKNMSALLATLIEKAENESWPLTVLKNINHAHLPLSGFSEYETYGTFALKYFPQEINVRSEVNGKIRSLRHGTKLFGTSPSNAALSLLGQIGLDYVTFEVWDECDPRRTNKNNKLAALHQISTQTWIPNIFKKIIERKITKQF